MFRGNLNVVRRPHFCDVASLLWGSLNVVMQPRCCEVASLFVLWRSLIVVERPLCCELSSLFWGSLIVGSQPQFCEVASLLWGSLNIVRQSHSCEGTLREPHLIYYLIFTTFSAWISSLRVPSPHSGSASTLAGLATFYNSASVDWTNAILTVGICSRCS